MNWPLLAVGSFFLAAVCFAGWMRDRLRWYQARRQLNMTRARLTMAREDINYLAARQRR